jgi:peptidoglycan/LPS O-acetylase OafA/YrhL
MKVDRLTCGEFRKGKEDMIWSLRNRPDSTSISNRNTNLDLLRATAICLVLIHHGVQMSPLTISWIRNLAAFGQYGVDLFFILSGWLIGGLYWRELKALGNVAIGRFWVRRWVRTIPPYLGALAISWTAVHIARGQSFDFGYLVFVQNFYQQMPFFLVSWSLCVEEHFYLLMPIAMFIVGRMFNRRGVISALLLLLMVPPMMRWLSYGEMTDHFGYFLTATHLHMSGLILGVLLSYLAATAPRTSFLLARLSPAILVTAGVSLFLLSLAGGILDYVLRETFIGIFFAAVLAFAVNKFQLRGRAAGAFYPISVCSYSIYLIHPLALHVATRAQLLIPGRELVCYFLSAGTFTLVASAVFYFGFERTSIRFRDYYWPRRRTAETSTVAKRA